MTSCTDLVNSDDKVIMDSIEKVDANTKSTGGGGTGNTGEGKGNG